MNLLKMVSNKVWLILILGLASLLWHGGRNALALPLGFGYNQGSISYSLLSNKDFRVYYETLAPDEGKFIFSIFNRAKPVLDHWLQKPRDRTLRVISSARSDNASFANFVTDTIELQTLGQGDRDLFMHEYVHTSMYEHLQNFLGPIGSLIYLPWMPAWWLEGLAESLSRSVGSDRMGSLERYYALSGNWPSFDRLHSLYGKYGFFESGYSISGAFVTYILTQAGPENLPTILTDFHRYAQPWWWPWASIPFNGFMPLDASLDQLTQKSTQELYESYKRAAKDHWSAVPHQGFFHLQKDPRLTSLSGSRTKSYYGSLVTLGTHNSLFGLYPLAVDIKTGWVNKLEPKLIKEFPSNLSSSLWAKVGEDFIVTQAETVEWGGLKSDYLSKIIASGNAERISDNLGDIWDMKVVNQTLYLLVHEGDSMRICFLPHPLQKYPGVLISEKSLTCIAEAKSPDSFSFLGAKEDYSKTGDAKLWVKKTRQSAKGNLYEILVIERSGQDFQSFSLDDLSTPLDLAELDTDIWLLIGKSNYRVLRKIDSQGNCLGELHFADHIEHIFDHKSILALLIKDGNGRSIKEINPKNYGLVGCTASIGHTSPLLAGIRGIDKIADAFKYTSLWEEPKISRGEIEALKDDIKEDQKNYENQEIKSTDVIEESPTTWRARSIAVLPWIGAEDPLGTQYGIFSIPLMSDLQNETLRLSLLYGIDSRYPATFLSLNSTRYRPTIDFSLFRQQTYNGNRYFPSTRTSKMLYYDEKGATLNVSLDSSLAGVGINLQPNLRYSYLTPYIGSDVPVRQGALLLVGMSLGISKSWKRFNIGLGLTGSFTPGVIGKNFDYNEAASNITVKYKLPFWASDISLGVEAARTRGSKMRNLRQIYQPLKTFIPGSGGGLTQNSFALTDPAYLFSSVFGDTQARFKANWVIPLVPDIDKQIWLFYLERLDLSNFYNYGAAWYQRYPPSREKLIPAHGHNIDLQFENKGVRLNAGIGAGKVMGHSYDAYVKFGFDALF